MTNDSDAPMVIFPHRGKLVLLGLGAAAFVLFGVWVALSPGVGLRWMPRWGSLTFAIVDVAFFGFCLAYVAARLIRRSPLLIIDADGADVRGSALAVVRLQWSEVAGAELVTFLGNRLLVIKVHDPASIIARQPRILRSLFRFNARLIGSPVCIPANVLPAPAEAVRDRIEAFRLRVLTR